jgi:2-methylfumaryl-CoA isomerase
LSLPAEPRAAPEPAPILGADTDEVLADKLGLSAGEIGRLRDAGIVA